MVDQHSQAETRNNSSNTGINHKKSSNDHPRTISILPSIDGVATTKQKHEVRNVRGTVAQTRVCLVLRYTQIPHHQRILALKVLFVWLLYDKNVNEYYLPQQHFPFYGRSSFSLETYNKWVSLKLTF